MKKLYPSGQAMPTRTGPSEPTRSNHATSSERMTTSLRSLLRVRSISPFYSYRRRAKVSSLSATSNLYDVLKRVDWLAIFSPWAIINRSKMYAMTTKQNTCTARTPAKNVTLQNFEKTHEDAEPLVSHRACELTEGDILSSSSQRDTNTTAGRTTTNKAALQNFEKTHEDAEPVVSHRAGELTEGNILSSTSQRDTNTSATRTPAKNVALQNFEKNQVDVQSVVSNRACELTEGNILSSSSQRDTNTSATRTLASNATLQNFEKTHEDAEPVVSNRACELTEGNSLSSRSQRDTDTSATRTTAKNAALKGLAIAKPAPICRRGGTTVVPNRACELSEGNIFSGEFFGSFFGVKKERPVAASDGKVAGRVNKTLSTSMDHTSFSSTLHLLSTIFVLLNFGFISATKAQSRQDVGTAEVVDDDWGKEIKITYKFLFDKKNYEHTKRVNPWADLEKFPMVSYELDYMTTPNLKIGDTIPSFLSQFPLNIVNEKGEREIVNLMSFPDDQLLVLDFWAPWCSPCIESMDKWNSYIQELQSPIHVIGVMLDYDYKAQHFGVNRGWRMPIAYGAAGFILNSLFFDRQVVSRSVWIKDGRLIAITGVQGYDQQLVKDVIQGKTVDIPSLYDWTYSQKLPKI